MMIFVLSADCRSVAKVCLILIYAISFICEMFVNYEMCVRRVIHSVIHGMKLKNTKSSV